MGKNTATVVKVDAVTALATSDAPVRAALYRSFPSSRCRWIDSSTTMELSTSIPIPRASPPSEMMLRVISKENMRKKVMITEMGMASPMMMVLRRFFRK